MVRNGRKSIWETQPEGQKTMSEIDRDWTAPIAPTAVPFAPAVPIVEQLRVADEKKRHRKWERGNKTHSYWGIPVELRQALGWAARDLNVKVDDVVRAFLEYGLEEYQQSRLVLIPYANPEGQKMTLYPDGWNHQPWRREKGNPKSRNPQEKHHTKKKPDGNPNKELTCVLAVRNLPAELHQAVLATATARSVPVGEVVVKFLGCGLDAFYTGALVLNPLPVIASQTLYPDAP